MQRTQLHPPIQADGDGHGLKGGLLGCMLQLPSRTDVCGGAIGPVRIVARRESNGQYLRPAETDVLREQAGPMVATLSSIVPELVTRLGDLSSSYPRPPEQARL